MRENKPIPAENPAETEKLKKPDNETKKLEKPGNPAAESQTESGALRILRRPEALRRELLRLEERRAACWGRCAYPARDSEQVHASRNIRKNEDSLTALAAVEAEMQNKRKELACAIETAETLLDRLEAAPGLHAYRNAVLLRLRYLENLSWPDVCAALRRNGFPVSVRNALFWRDAALKQLDSLPIREDEAKVPHT